MISNNIDVKIFIGFLKNGELKMHMHQSASWKESTLLQTCHLKEAQFQDKEYIGLFLNSSLSYDHLKTHEQVLKSQMEVYFPKFNAEKHALYLFPQIFIS